MPGRRLLETLEVASLLVYPSRPQSDADDTARKVVVMGVKQGKPRHLERVGVRMAELDTNDPVRLLVPADAILVPAPRSTPLAKGALWPSKLIAEALVAAGVGGRVSPLLERIEPVRRSTGARTAVGREPPLRHHETLAAAGPTWPLGEAPHLVLIDDVVTTGATLIACASRLTEAVPGARITAFAVARAERFATLGEAGEMFSPKAETITLRSDEGRSKRS